MKLSADDLAVFTGIPAFGRQLHVGQPDVGRRSTLMRHINGILDRHWLTNDGPCVRELEGRIAELLGVRHAIPLSSGTCALEIAVKALELRGEVILPSMTFVATAHALEWHGIVPVFCDIDPETHNLDPGRVEELITPRTTGIVGVHLWGRPCDVERLAHIAARHKLRLLFDAAHAFRCSYKGRMIGNFGDLEVFSFHATKFFHTIEGGAVTTNDGELAKRVRLMSNHGFVGYDAVGGLGINGKMNEISAAMGLTLCDDLERLVAANRRNYRQYKSLLEGLPGVAVAPYDETEQCNYQYVVLEIDERSAFITRDQLAGILWAENVLARRYFYPGCHRMQPYLSKYPNAARRLPHTESLCRRVLCLPTGTSVGPEEIETIAGIIRIAVTDGRRLAGRLPERLHSAGA